ncbi:hypothetical protein F8M41_005056 [Gigaspora margarita]|uniref:Uncharacterized protein n=1 Tax=Gigaspora margarita TaxID=4874 RepID=A0A8H3XBR2_GIGMA|nr:hypothetical protein F8M41_005056 [Gigaspora margarita]
MGVVPETNEEEKDDNSYDVEKAKKEFKNITSPTLFNLSDDFKNIVKKNLSSKIYYRFESDNITNSLSLKQFSSSMDGIGF